MRLFKILPLFGTLHAAPFTLSFTCSSTTCGSFASHRICPTSSPITAFAENVVAEVDSISAGERRDEVLRGGLSKMSAAMTRDFFESHPSLKRLYTNCAKLTDVRPSTISPDAGSGLFANKNIKAGTIVSFYPVHSLGTDDPDRGPSFVFDADEDSDHFLKNPSFDSPYLHVTDQPLFRRPSLFSENGMGSSDDVPIYLDANPTRGRVDPAWRSHYINDGAVVDANTEESVLSYYAATSRRKNCIHIPFGPSPVLATIASKKIKKGEELFTSYGCTYWLGEIKGIAENTEETVGMTPLIRKEIEKSAQDLIQGMDRAEMLYRNEAEAFKISVDSIIVS